MRGKLSASGKRPALNLRRLETAQLYIHERYAPISTPVKNLRGFERVALNPGETKTVTMKLTPEELQLLDIDMRWRVVPGDFDIMAGKSSADADLVLRGVLKVAPSIPGASRISLRYGQPLLMKREECYSGRR
jgi:hypothetical protein